jgi:hypothetical protein
MSWLRIAMSPGVIGRAVKVALVVGSVLNLVNQGAVLLSGDLASFDALQGLLNFVVPYCVATYGATAALMAQAKERAPRPEAVPETARRAA